VPAFRVDPAQVEGARLFLCGPEAHHLARVRRHRVGELVEVLDGNGHLYEVRIDAIEADRVRCAILSCRDDQGEEAVRLDLAPAVTKGSRFDRVVEKATELGVAHLHPVVAARGVAGPGSPQRVERWRRIAQAAAKQCGRSRLPGLEPPSPFPQVLHRLTEECQLVLLAAPGAPALALPSGEVTRVGLLVGPEGGFAPSEEELARRCGARVFSWGTRTLRADTAAVVLAALVMHEAGRTAAGGTSPGGPAAGGGAAGAATRRVADWRIASWSCTDPTSISWARASPARTADRAWRRSTTRSPDRPSSWASRCAVCSRTAKER
jgi:16S rRNA (uracil1498-N3)-methyltransferase